MLASFWRHAGRVDDDRRFVLLALHLHVLDRDVTVDTDDPVPL